MGTMGLSITLANSIIGVGILAMPFCFQQCGIALATLILLLMGLISRLCCYFLLKSALIARRRNFEFLAFHVFGSAGKLFVEVGIIGFLMGTCIAYFVVVGDLGPQIIAKMFNINQSDILRTSIMVIVSLVCVLPLGLLRNVDSLSNVSAATIGFYFCLVMKVSVEAAGGPWRARWWRPAGVLQCVPIFSMALFCQTQLFEIFESMPTLSLEKMNVVTKNAINICTGIYFTLGLFGYIAFSSQTISGNILMSLSPTLASDVIKLGFVMSLAFSFPLIIFPCRASLYSFLYKKVHSSHHDHIVNQSIPAATFRCITVGIVAAALVVGLMIPNIELVLGLVGSTIGVLICVIFPCACFISVTFKNTNERLLAKAVLALGLVILVLGTYANLEAVENNHDRYDEKYLTQLQIDKMLDDFVQKQGVQAQLEVQKKVKELNQLKKEEIINDSEVQPPNPVPPEMPSNGNVEQENKEESIKQKDILPDDKEKQVLTKSKEDYTKDNNGKVENQINDIGIVRENEISNPKENVQDKPKQSAEDKNDMIKQKQLIETIKQHGEEQRELLKEQKEILDKIKQTKNEIEHKKDVDSDEAKKIAVESIKQIANVAIQSLTGKTDKPDQQNEEQKHNFEKLANEAVQDIAMKVVKTFQALEPELAGGHKPAPVIPAINASVRPLQDQNNNPLPAQNVQNQPNMQINPEQQIQNEIPNKHNNILPKAELPNRINLNSNANHAPIEQTQNFNGKVINNNAPNVITGVNNIPMNSVPITSQLGQNVQQDLKINQPGNVQLNQQNVGQNKPQNVQQYQQQYMQQNQNNKQQELLQKEQQYQAQNIHLQQPNVPQNQQPNMQQNVQLENQKQDTLQNQHQNVQEILQKINQQINMQQNQQQNMQPIQQQNVPETKHRVIQQNVQNPQPNIPNKEHSHSPDEPQSYKQGEDSQKQKNDPIISNSDIIKKVPLPVAINGNTQLYKDTVAKLQSAREEQRIYNEENHIRHKREIDCTQTTKLQDEHKQICDSIDKNSGTLPSNIDLAEIGIQKRVPLEDMHHLRSLKSYDENDRER